MPETYKVKANEILKFHELRNLRSVRNLWNLRNLTNFRSSFSKAVEWNDEGITKKLRFLESGSRKRKVKTNEILKFHELRNLRSVIN